MGDNSRRFHQLQVLQVRAISVPVLSPARNATEPWLCKHFHSNHIVACRLVARQQPVKSKGGIVLSVRSVPRCYKQDWESVELTRVEAGSNTSTVALRVVEGDEKLIQFLGAINKRSWPSRLGDSRIWDNKMWSWVPRESDLIMTLLVRASSNCKRQTHLLVREDVT
jgi:hypothetical protein